MQWCPIRPLFIVFIGQFRVQSPHSLHCSERSIFTPSRLLMLGKKFAKMFLGNGFRVIAWSDPIFSSRGRNCSTSNRLPSER